MLKSWGVGGVGWGGVGGPCDFVVSPRSKSFFSFLGDFYSTLVPVGTSNLGLDSDLTTKGRIQKFPYHFF